MASSRREVPLRKLKAEGAGVHVLAPKVEKSAAGTWGTGPQRDKRLAEVSADEHDALVLPGGSRP